MSYMNGGIFQNLTAFFRTLSAPIIRIKDVLVEFPVFTLLFQRKVNYNCCRDIKVI